MKLLKLVLGSSRTLLPVLVLVAFASAEDTFTQCNEKCKEKGDDKLIEACNNGCKSYNYKQNRQSIFRNPFFATRNSEDVLNQCSNDCQRAYVDNVAKSCTDGCTWMKELSANGGFRTGGISISFGKLPEVGNIFNQINGFVNQQIQEQNKRLQSMLASNSNDRKGKKIEDEDEDEDEEDEEVEEKEEKGMMGGLLKSMHEQMKNIMQKFISDNTEEGEDFRGESGKLLHGGGELVVVKSGPGYHQKKTYHIGPDADIEKILDDNMGDMLSHKNPMEKFTDDKDVEVFKPDEQNTEIKPASSFFDTDPWGLIKKLGFINDKEDLDGPKLPETGLKSKEDMIIPAFGKNFHGYVIVDRDICAKDKHEMTWGEWFTCLHVKMGLPNWLLVSTVALGVIFTLWLCLAIPTNAPKQKVRKPKNIGVKELEAASMGGVACVEAREVKIDLPPAYDDVAKNELEPVHEKIALEKDDEIAEPLPLKVEHEDRNCSNV